MAAVESAKAGVLCEGRRVAGRRATPGRAGSAGDRGHVSSIRVAVSPLLSRREFQGHPTVPLGRPIEPIDVASNGLLKYNNEDGGDSFQYRLANIEQITSFELTVHNQDDEFIPSFSDYILLLQFIRHSTQEDKTHTILESILDYIKQMYLIISQIVFPPSY